MVAKKSITKYFQESIGNLQGIGLELSSLLVFMVSGILTFFILKHTVPSRKYGQMVLYLLLMFIFLAGLRYFIEEVVYLYFFGSGNYYGNIPVWYYLVDNSYFTSDFSLIGAIYFFFVYSIFNETQHHKTIAENKKSELSFLKSQINPHFLFNSLNNLYSLVYYKSDMALDYISKLSNLIRYSLYESDEKIALKKEINYLNDFIDLEKIRLDYSPSLKMDIGENIGNIKIPPYIFAPFVENAFKHGDLKNEEQPIEIKIKKEGKDLWMSVKNKIKKKEKDKTGGIGLENLKKRLELIYGQKHELNISEKKDTFETNLKLIDIC